MKILLGDPKIREAESNMKESIVRYKRVVYNAVAACKHLSVGECTYLKYDYCDSLPPLRVCLDCGLTEEGWGHGYIILKREYVTILSRDTVSGLRTVHIDREDQGSLIRCDVTFPDMIAKKLGVAHEP